MSSLPPCPECNGTYTYESLDLLACPECGHEWKAGEQDANDGQKEGDNERVIVDANGNPLADGDTVTVIKDLKIKGSSQVVKVGTKVRNIRLVDGDHDIDCKIEGIGAMKLKSCFVKKG
jgi:protein PhnA